MTAPPRPTSLGIGVIGLGVMGRTHIAAYQSAAADGLGCRLIAVCDPDPARRTGLPGGGGNIGAAQQDRLVFDPRLVRPCATPEELFADDEVGLVSICTYTDSHVALAMQALAAGKHVLVEKPVSLQSNEVARLARAAETALKDRGLFCMPAMCMRFWPGWDWLRDRVKDGSLGKVRSATFQRLGSGPTWAPQFYRDSTRSGGALFDLHIHDADFIYWCFGPPAGVSSAGDDQHVTTIFRFEGADAPVHVVAEAAWDLAPGAGFRMRFLVNFERATAEFDLARTPRLVLHTQEGSSAIEPSSPGIVTGYDGEVRHLVQAISAGSSTPGSTTAEALTVTALLEAARRSTASGRPELPAAHR